MKIDDVIEELQRIRAMRGNLEVATYSNGNSEKVAKVDVVGRECIYAAVIPKSGLK